MTWNDVTIDMKPPTCTREDVFHVEEELFVSDETDCIAKILNAKYKPMNLKEITEKIIPAKQHPKRTITHISRQATRDF